MKASIKWARERMPKNVIQRGVKIVSTTTIENTMVVEGITKANVCGRCTGFLAIIHRIGQKEYDIVYTYHRLMN